AEYGPAARRASNGAPVNILSLKHWPCEAPIGGHFVATLEAPLRVYAVVKLTRGAARLLFRLRPVRD
ncbi:MAG TPA: hypothetical protein VNM46_03780, partial [Xanthobacteraceae bacterium]|nr:hypothetical protein [Xanthobacteraceae bacterium]